MNFFIGAFFIEGAVALVGWTVIILPIPNRLVGQVERLNLLFYSTLRWASNIYIFYERQKLGEHDQLVLAPDYHPFTVKLKTGMQGTYPYTPTEESY